MTITTNDVRDEYTASAAQTVFNYTFKIFADGQLNVYITPAGQEPNDSSDITTAYTIDPSSIGDEDGGFLTLDSGTTNGDRVTIVSDIPEARTTDYQNSGDFLPDVVNDDFDTVVSLVKQVEDKANRTLAFQNAVQNASGLTLPEPSAGLFMVWNGTETGLENTGVPSVIVPGDLSGTLTALKSATNLTIGDFVVTTGYNANGDGGDNTYEIVAASTGTDDGGSFIDLNVLQAKGLFPKGFVNLKQYGVAGLGGNNDEQPQIQAALNYAVANKMRLHCPSPAVTYAMAAEVNLDEFLGQQDLNVQISGEGFSSNYVDGGSSSLFTHVDGYTGYLFDLSISIAPATSWFTLVMENINLWGKNVNLGDGMRVIGCHYFLSNVGMNELDRAFRPEQCFRGDVRGCSIARNNLAIQFAGYCSATTFSGSTIRGNTTAVEFAASYPSTYGNDNRLDNVNFLFNNMESNDTIFDLQNGDSTHFTSKYNYTEGIGDVLFDCSNGAYEHSDLKFEGMARQLVVRFNKCFDVELIGQSIDLESYSTTNSKNLVIKNSDTTAIATAPSTANMYLVPGNKTEFTLNDDPDFTLHSLMTAPFVLPREWSDSSATPTYSWVTDTPYGYTKKVMKYDGASGALALRVPLKEPKIDTYVHGLVSVRVETGVCRIGYQVVGGGVNYQTPLTVDSAYQQLPLRLPISAGDAELKIYLDGNSAAAVFYVDAVILGYSLYPEFKQSESFAAQVTVPTGAGLTLTGDTDLLVQATPVGATVMMGVNGNGTTTPDIVHSGGGNIDATLLVTPRQHAQKWRVR